MTKTITIKYLWQNNEGVNKLRSLKKTMPPYILKRLGEGGFMLAFAGALFVLLSLLTYQVNDPSWTHAFRSGSTISNLGGAVGAYIADALYFVFGYFAYVLPICLIYVAWTVLKDLPSLKAAAKPVLLLRTVGFMLMVCGGCGLLSLEGQIDDLDSIHSAGGVIGQAVGLGWYQILNFYGATLALTTMLLVGMTWLTGISWVRATELIGYYTLVLIHVSFSSIKKILHLGNAGIERYQFRQVTNNNNSEEDKPLPKLFKTKKEKDIINEKEVYIEKEKAVPVLIASEEKPVIKKPIPEIIRSIKEPKEIRIPKVSVSGSLPDLNLLDKGQPGKPMGGYTHHELEQLSREVEQHLLDFGIQADVVAVHPGPVVTRFELQLAAGVKVSKLTALSKDLARSLSVISVRVVEVIPGKTVVGLELPNQSREMVRLSDVLSAEVYQQAHSSLTLALGVDIAGTSYGG